MTWEHFMRGIDVAFIMATCIVLGVILFGVYRFHFKMRALSGRMAQYMVWNEEQSCKLAAGQLTETQRQELIHYGLRCIHSHGRWNYRGPWEKQAPNRKAGGAR